MRDYFKKVLHITGEKTRQLPWMLMLYFVAMALELIGISMIIPLIKILQDPDSLNKYEIWIQMTQAFEIKSDFQAIVFLSTLIFIIYTIKTLLNIQTQRAILNFSYDFQIYLRVKLSKLYLDAPYLFHTKRRSNEIINILHAHVNQFPKAVIGSWLRIAGESLTLLAIGIFLLIGYPVPTITALALLSIFGLCYDRFVKQGLRKAGEELISANNDMIKSIKEGVNSIKEARVLGRSDYFHANLADSARRASNVNAYVAIMQMLPRYFLELLMVTVVLAASLFMLFMGDDGNAVIDSLAIFAVAALRMLPASNQIISNIGSLRYSSKMVDELYADLDELESAASTKRNINSEQNFESFTMNDTSFTYPDTDKAVLYNVDLSFKKGEIIGVVGPSGSGKSTLVNIILGLLKPDNGQFILNGQEISADEWASHQYGAYIPQKPAMLDDSVSINIALGQDHQTQDHAKITQALEKAQLKEVIENLPKKTDTILGEDAVLFSGGQKQRIALARTFYFDREIIIFDEATSALDKSTEQEVLKAIKNLRQDATLLIVTHSEQPLEICDRIYHLSDGKIVKETKNEPLSASLL